MSLLLDFDRPRTVVWEQANATIDIIPLTSEMDMKFTRDTTKEIFNDRQFKRNEQDTNEYMRLVGQYCIKGWTGIYLQQGSEADCTSENIAKAMRLEAVQNFVLNKVLDLNIVLGEEVVKAKKE